jgi:hypothetical protein
MPYSANNVPDLQFEQPHIAGGSTLDSALVEVTDAATLAWLVSALGHARTRGQRKLVGYLEAVMEDVVFEVEAAARRLRYIESPYSG